MRLSFIISKQESEIGSLQCRLASLHGFCLSMRGTCAARGSGADDSRRDQI